MPKAVHILLIEDDSSLATNLCDVLKEDGYMTRRLLLGARGLSISADAVRQTLAARNNEAVPTGNSFAACAGDLLVRAQKGELHDAHTRMLAEAEREILTQAITLAEGNQAKAARWLGLSRFTLREKLKQLGLHPDSTEASSVADG